MFTNRFEHQQTMSVESFNGVAPHHRPPAADGGFTNWAVLVDGDDALCLCVVFVWVCRPRLSHFVIVPFSTHAVDVSSERHRYEHSCMRFLKTTAFMMRTHTHTYTYTQFILSRLFPFLLLLGSPPEIQQFNLSNRPVSLLVDVL